MDLKGKEEKKYIARNKTQTKEKKKKNSFRKYTPKKEKEEHQRPTEGPVQREHRMPPSVPSGHLLSTAGLCTP